MLFVTSAKLDVKSKIKPSNETLEKEACQMKRPVNEQRELISSPCCIFPICLDSLSDR